MTCPLVIPGPVRRKSNCTFLERKRNLKDKRRKEKRENRGFKKGNRRMEGTLREEKM